MLRMTKAELYDIIDSLRSDLELIGFTTPFNSRDVCVQGFGLFYDEAQLGKSGLRGVAHIPTRTVIIDSSMTDREKCFYTFHECLHHRFCPNLGNQFFWDYDEFMTVPEQDPFLEWQCNEGAAQLLLPYQSFIPRYVEIARANSNIDELRVIESLVEEYNVTGRVVTNRISSLNYEICCYLDGVDITAPSFIVRSRNYLNSIQWIDDHKRHLHPERRVYKPEKIITRRVAEPEVRFAEIEIVGR